MPEKVGAGNIRKWELQRRKVTYLTNVKIMPGQRKTTLAIARPLLLYFNGLPP